MSPAAHPHPVPRMPWVTCRDAITDAVPSRPLLFHHFTLLRPHLTLTDARFSSTLKKTFVQDSLDQELVTQFSTGHESDLKRPRQLGGLTQCPCVEDEPTVRLGDEWNLISQHFN